MKLHFAGLFFLLVIQLIPVRSFSQNSTSVGDSTSFDFWVGEWSATWKDSDTTTGTGENSITKIMGGKVIQEQFRGLTGANAGYIGMSVSVLAMGDKKWHQTWVDNQGAYLDFTGGMMGEDRFFTMEKKNPKGETIHMRMVFYNISTDSFDWRWERSADGGKNWTPNWQIHYVRKKL